MTILIGLNGYKRSGKDTAANAIQKWGDSRVVVVTRRAFAELLKLSAARALGLPVATNINDAVVLMDQLKEDGWLEVSIPGQSYMQAIEGREFLKWYGTEAHRDVFGKNFWVDQILPLHYDWTLEWINEDDDPCDIAVVTDVRFVNEAERIKLLGGVIWNIKRPGTESDGHPSEMPLPDHFIDKVIHNDKSLEAFEVAVNTEMTIDYHMNFVERPDPLDA